MHLKKVEMENFKSFGRKLSVPFLEGFTAVTGPNGSGKSNIVDAILFVLGPKSSKIIRAGKLTDLIFNGGKERKPSDYCRVTLVFDNSDRLIPIEDEEVRLTRLVKLSKNNKENYYSYFYVNGRASSLSEFESLLSYARISADGYNIVQQGDVTRIVEMGAVERRRILDNIAGISKFDDDIEKAEKEKIEVDLNINNIKIVVNELSSQLRRLANERDAAVKHKQLKEEVTMAKAQLATRKKHNAELELSSIKENIASYEKEKAAFQNKLGTMVEEKRSANERLNETENKITAMSGEEGQKIKEQIDECRLARDKATVSIENSQEALRHLKSEKAQVEEDAKKVQKTIDEYAKERQALEKTFVERKKVYDAKDREYQKLNELMSKSDDATRDIQKKIIAAGEGLDRRRADSKTFTLEQDRANEKIERLKNSIALLEDSLGKYEFEAKDIAFALKESTGESGSSESVVKEAQDRLFSLKKQEATLAEELENLEPKIRQLTRQYEQMKAEGEAAESVRRGYNRAVNAVLEARDKGELRGIHGTIAELIRVDPQYETAVSIAGGAGMQFIIVNNDEDGARAINYLKQNRIGRATFLPLNKVKTGMPKGQSLLAVRQGIGFAMDLIDFDEKYKSAIWQAFRDTIVVENLNTARKLMGGVRLVTLDGDLVEASGAMVGGSINQNRPKMGGGQNNLEKISKELRTSIDRQDILAGNLKTIREDIDEIYHTLTEEKSKLSVEQSKIGDLDMKRKEYEAKLEALHRDIATQKNEYNAAEVALAEYGAKYEENEKAINALEDERKELREDLLKMTDQKIAQKARELDAENKELAKEVMGLQSKRDTIAEQIAVNDERRTELATRLSEIAQRVGEHKDTITAQERIAKENQEKLNVLVKIESEMSAELKGLMKERDDLYKICVDLDSEITKCQDKINVNEDLIIRAKTRFQPLVDAIAEYANEIITYNVTVEGDIPPLDELNRRIVSCEQQMQALEPVNMRAIEEYDETNERKEKLDAEFTELGNHRQHLITLVDEIKKKKKANFFVVFDEVNIHFQETFSRVSAGGLAALVLENPEDPFEGGMTLKSQPKGKKVLRLESLSGGEKSLTALSFIFAIQRHQPSPFYVLDEVDMFLDGVNSELISEVVKDNSKLAQFIMVSLREVTLKNADHVYGVTMKANGISEMIGEIKLAENALKGKKERGLPDGAVAPEKAEQAGAE